MGNVLTLTYANPDPNPVGKMGNVLTPTSPTMALTLLVKWVMNLPKLPNPDPNHVGEKGNAVTLTYPQPCW